MKTVVNVKCTTFISEFLHCRFLCLILTLMYIHSSFHNISILLNWHLNTVSPPDGLGCLSSKPLMTCSLDPKSH